MEEIFGAFLLAVSEIVGDVLFELIGEGIFSLIARGFYALGMSPRTLNRAMSAFMYLLFGAMAGCISILIFPHPLVRPSRFHGISLLISPLLAGSAMSLVGSSLRRKGKRTTQIETFGYGFAFAFAMALVRLIVVH